MLPTDSGSSSNSHRVAAESRNRSRKRSGRWHIFICCAVYVEGRTLPLAFWFLTFINFATILLGCTTKSTGGDLHQSELHVCIYIDRPTTRTQGGSGRGVSIRRPRRISTKQAGKRAPARLRVLQSLPRAIATSSLARMLADEALTSQVRMGSPFVHTYSGERSKLTTKLSSTTALNRLRRHCVSQLCCGTP